MLTRNNCSSNRESRQYVNKKQQNKYNEKSKRIPVYKNNEEHWKRYIRSNANSADV